MSAFDDKRVDRYWENHDKRAEARAMRARWAQANADDLWALLSALAENGCVRENHRVAAGVIRRLLGAPRPVGPCPRCGTEWSTCPCGKVDPYTGDARPPLADSLGQIAYNEGGAPPPPETTEAL